jgi:molecular chaperone GrpE (heat shock protein)
MDPLELLRARASEVLRAATAERRAAERERQQARAELGRVALAAVEALETVADTLEGLRDELPANVRELVALSSKAAWERLEAAGITRDGREGEPLDLTRHRVLKTVAGARPGAVAAVLTPGITLGGARLRDAVVSAGPER